MSKKEKLLILLILAFSLAVAILLGTKTDASLYGKIVTVKGTVHYISESESWGILGDDGRKYDPLSLPPELMRPGLKAEFRLMMIGNYAGLETLWGTMVSIINYKILNQYF